MEQATPLRPIDQQTPELSDDALELQQYLDDSERIFQRAIDSLNGLNAQPDPSTELDEVRCSETLRELLALKVKAQELAITAKAHQIATAPALVSDAPASASLDGKQKTETQILIESAIGENSKRMLIMARVMSDKDGYFGNLHKDIIVQESELPVSTVEDRIEDPVERTERIAKALVTDGGVVDSDAQEKVRASYRLSAETLKLITDNIALFSDTATARAIEAKRLLDAEREREIAEAEAAAAQQEDGPEEISLDRETIQEVIDAIEERIQSYRDQAIEVLSRKRTRVVDALNATLGMQSVINELKVKGMKHGVSPDLISISLVSLTSGEINENIIFQMQERSRNIVDEISQCTKEIALSDPSKWEHSVNKYNTVEAWKARFGKAKPIEAAAQATGLHDRAERRSREAREEVRLALGAVAEFGGGPEQVGPEDAMEQLQNSPVLLARIRHVHEDAQKRKGELENQKKELEVMLVYVEKCVERAKELKRALDGYDRRLDALTNENSPIGPLRLRLQELESAQAEDWDLDAMIEVCGRLRDMHHDAGETHDKELMEQRIQIIEGLKAERSRAQSATPPNPSDNTPVAAAGASGQPPEGGGGSPTAEATPRVERTKKSYEHTMAITLPVTKTIEVPFPGLVVDGKQAVIRVELIPNGTEIVWREDKSKEGGGEWVDESRFTPAISVIFDEDDERQKLLLDGLIAKGTQTSANVMTVYSGSQDMYRWGVRRSNGNDGEALVGSELQLQIWCDVDTVRQENIVRTVDGIAQTEGGDELGALTDQMTALWAQSDKENDLSKKLKCYKDALEIAQRINYAEAIKNSKDGILYVESLILGNEISTQVAEIVAGYTEKADLSAFLTQARELTGKISKLYAMEVQNSHENPRWSVSTAVDALIDLYERTVMSGCIGEEKYADVITVAREVQGILNTFEVSEHTERFQARVLAYLADSYEGAKQYSLATSTLREFIDMAKRVYGGKHYNPRSDEERLSQLKALQAEQKSTEGGGGALIEGFANPDTFRIGEPVQLRWDMQTEHSLSCAEDRKVSIIVWRRGDENFQVNLYDERNNDSREGAMTLTEARAVGPFMNLIKKKDGGDITENWDVKVEVGEIGTDRLLPLTLTVTSKTSAESGASTSDLPAYIADEIKTAPWIPEKLKDQVFRLYELSWAATQKELALVAKAEEWAKAAGIPVVSHAVAGFAEFIQGAFSVRDMQTGKITDESVQRAKDHFAQWFTEGLKGTAELGELFVGGEVGVLKDILTKEGADLADSSNKRIISGYIMRHLASKLGAASDTTEGSGLKAMGNILAELLQNEGNLTQMVGALEDANGFDAFLAKLKEYFSNHQSTA